MLTQDRVKKLFDYDEGNLIRKVQTSNRVQVGDIVGCLNSGGYLQTGIDGKMYYIHRLVWLWHKGYFPEHGLDHINQKRINNRIENLREVSQRCNLRNSKQRKFTSGIKGVSWNKREKKWKAQIHINGKKIHLGIHDDILEAACHRLAAEQAEGWSGCDSTSPAFLYVKNNV